jgi:hypothetical protein
MTKYWHKFFEDYAGCFYDFERAGDCIPTHAHTPETAHDVTCLQGLVRVNQHLVHPGETYKFDSLRDHEIVALMPQTRTLHVYDQFPSHYLKLPPECLEGTINAFAIRREPWG